MTHVHYKFSSKLSYDTVVFDGPHITLGDLKRQIMGREKLRAGDCDLQITNGQTKEEYTEDDGLIPKGSSVIVRRIPLIGARSNTNKTRNIERSDVQQHSFGAAKAMDDQDSSGTLPLFSKMANLADADVSEEDKLKVILNQNTYDSVNYKKFGTALPANYTCYRCGNTGHHIRNCPTSGDKNFEAPPRLKKSTGIPRSFMVEVDDPNIKGAMLTNCGHYAIPAIHAKAYAIGKKEKPPFVPQEQPKTEEKEEPIPDELVCLICHDLLSDAVVIPCCGNSYCDDCIRTTLLDSEEHVCPTCNQSDVSPDNLIANKFLRQAVNTFKKEQSGMCGTSQSQNPTQTSSPVPTPPPLITQSQTQKLYQSSHSQQDPLVPRSQAADTPSSSQVCGDPPTSTDPDPASNTPSTSLQPTQSHLDIFDKEAEEKTHDDSAAAAPSVPVSHKDPAAAPSQLIPLVNHAPEVEQPQTVSVNLQQASTGPPPGLSGPSKCWESSTSSSSSCPTRSWSESFNTQQLPPSSTSSSSSYPAVPPPLFPSPLFHTFLAAQQPLNSYHPGYPPATPVWTLPTPQGAPIPSLCSSTAASPIPALIPKEWYMHQRNKKERSPHRGSAYRRSSSRSNSKSSKSKSSRSYSRSSSRSRSRSRSRSQSRSRPHSPYSHHRDLHSRSHSSHSYSYGYKRSPTPSSSSSPRVPYPSRSKSSSDRRKTSHHGRHHHKKSALSGHSSRKQGECSQAGGPGGSSTSHPNSQEMDRERYLQWERDYKEWYGKYFNSYVSHFHQLPPPLLSLPPTPHPQWGDRDGSRKHSQDRLQGRRSARMDGHSPPSQSSSDSRSPPSQSSSDSRSTPSQSSSKSRSSPSHSSNDSRSPPYKSSSDSRSTPSEDKAKPRAHQQKCSEKYSRPPIALTKSSTQAERQERGNDDKQLIAKNLKSSGTLKHEQKSVKKHKEGRGEESSSPDVADSADDYRKDKRRHKTSVQDKVTANEASESVQPLMKPDKHLDKEKGWRRGKYSGSRQDVERRHKEKSSKGAERAYTDRYRHRGGGKDADSRSEKNRKRKGEDVERSFVQAKSSRCLKTKLEEVPKIRKSESPKPFNKKTQKTEKKKESKSWPLTERDIWEGGMKVKPQKKISININLDMKRKEENTEKQDASYLESISGKTTEDMEPSRDQKDVSEEKIKPDDGETRPVWKTITDDKREVWEKVSGERKKEDKLEEDFDLWRCAFKGVEEEKKESQIQWEEQDWMKVTNNEKKTAEGGSTGKEKRESKPKGGVMEGVMGEDEGTTRSQRSRNESHHDGLNITVDDGSSYEDRRQERKMVVKTLEEYTHNRAADRQGELVLIQVPRSKWEKEESDAEERGEEEIKVQSDALAAFPPLAETPTERETEEEHEDRRHKGIEKDIVRAVEREKNSTLSSSHRSMAPSSGKDKPGSTLSSERMEMERPRDGERGRESERPRERPKESRRSKERERTRMEVKGKDRGREKGHKRNLPSSSSYSHTYPTSLDTERRDRQRGDDQGSNKSSYSLGGKSISSRSQESSTLSRAAEVSDPNAHKTYRDTFLDLKFSEDLPHHYHQDRPARTHCSPPSLSHSQGKERDPLPYESSGGSELSKHRASSPARELTQNISRNVGKVEMVEWKRQTRWEESGELEEGERPSSNSISSSASHESSSSGDDDMRKEWKKKHKKEKRQAAPEPLEEGELKKHKKKKSRKSRGDREEEESEGEVEDAKLCALMLF
ncbi:E3 ubiquitin-protein ligase RBBP6 isoform X2 [Larimichthys crocea]|uniref:E3 ubiquitin-protein ligase RBBP6 isoform X2 n=1 Tax=Larimichthys crocea TaxID=215358 RepID=UPI000F60181C|nr:E3 ubiquitin-protein ligase RBBP6 isoform X2 [Larimichthys crocea]